MFEKFIATIAKRVKELLKKDALFDLSKLILELDKTKKYLIVVPSNVFSEKEIEYLTKYFKDNDIQTKIVLIMSDKLRIIEFE